MAVTGRARAARRPEGAGMVPARPYRSMAQLEDERERRENFVKGSNYAAAALCGMFAVLSLGAVFLGW